MAESRKSIRSEAMKNKAKLQLKQASAQAQAQRLKHLANRPKPQITGPAKEKK